MNCGVKLFIAWSSTRMSKTFGGPGPAALPLDAPVHATAAKIAASTAAAAIRNRALTRKTEPLSSADRGP